MIFCVLALTSSYLGLQYESSKGAAAGRVVRCALATRELRSAKAPENGCDAAMVYFTIPGVLVLQKRACMVWYDTSKDAGQNWRWLIMALCLKAAAP